MSESEAWNQRYVDGRTAWDLGGPPPALVRVIAARKPSLRVLVPGAGRGHDALAWAQAGHQVVAVDFAPLAVIAAKENAAAHGVAMEVHEGDIFALPDTFAASFDLVWEQTCFCAIPPERRADYARSMATVLRPGGHIVALLWNHGREGGPPYDVTREDVDRVFSEAFVVEEVSDVPDSPAGRDPEILATLRRV